MNKKTATYNASDVYRAFVEEFIKNNPDHWKGFKGDRTPNIYKKGPNDTVIVVMTQARWMKIVNLYYLMARKKVIAGERFNLGHRLGAIQARTIARNFNNKQIDWAETKKQPWVIDETTGKRKRARIVYHMSDEYSRIAWEKLGSISNETFYKFKPCKGNAVGKGFAREFSAALKADPLLARKYKQHRDELPIN